MFYLFFREPVDDYIILRVISLVNFTIVFFKKEKKYYIFYLWPIILRISKEVNKKL